LKVVEDYTIAFFNGYLIPRKERITYWTTAGPSGHARWKDWRRHLSTVYFV